MDNRITPLSADPQMPVYPPFFDHPEFAHDMGGCFVAGGAGAPDPMQSRLPKAQPQQQAHGLRPKALPLLIAAQREADLRAGLAWVAGSAAPR